MVRGEMKKTFSIRSKKKVKSDADRISTGSTDQRPTVKVFLPNGEFRSVKCGDTTDIKDIIHLVIESLGVNVVTAHIFYGMRIEHPQSLRAFWLRRWFTVQEVRAKYEHMLPLDECRYTLRIKFFPEDLTSFYLKDKASFFFLYDQIKNDYLNHVAEKVDQDIAFRLGALEMRRHFKDMPPNALGKKSNFEILEKEVGFTKFLPKSIIETMKSKALRKILNSYFKQYSELNEEQCCHKFLELLPTIHRYDLETFKCSLGVSIAIYNMLTETSARSLECWLDIIFFQAVFHSKNDD
ncbi:focal adhesion kinase 1-like isoform X5 [Paramuricea clavata]|uniref:non-specific protein-tyrosine kinase n=1 Tax=Paramuricea clavata TaxID=317549 RepID=A0A7D9E409_PARCT|nr:focal adhesion kinase 1-like isoform X5 [Paramuricea clavata]